MTSLTDERPVSDKCLSTLLTKVERIINSRPLTPLSSNPFHLAALSPNSLLNGRLDASLPLDKFIQTDGYRKSWRVVGSLADQFWSRWIKEYLPTLQIRQKWLKCTPNMRVEDLVLVKDETLMVRGSWPKARELEVFPGSDGAVCTAQVQTANSSYVRNIRKLCVLEACGKEREQ